MKNNFEKAFQMLLEFEGYKSWDEWGGDTLFGITKRWFPDVVEKIRKAKTKEEKLQIAKEFYKKEFWDTLRCDLKLYPLDIIYFDTGVNLGKTEAMIFRKKFHDVKDIILLECVFILFLRSMYYVERCLRNKRKRKYLFGWLNRVYKLFKFVEEEVEK